VEVTEVYLGMNQNRVCDFLLVPNTVVTLVEWCCFLVSDKILQVFYFCPISPELLGCSRPVGPDRQADQP